MWLYVQDIKLIYKNLFFQNETGQNQGRKHFQASTQSKGTCLELKQSVCWDTVFPRK